MNAARSTGDASTIAAIGRAPVRCTPAAEVSQARKPCKVPTTTQVCPDCVEEHSIVRAIRAVQRNLFADRLRSLSQ